MRAAKKNKADSKTKPEVNAYASLAERESTRSDELACSLKEARETLNKLSQEHNSDQREIERLSTHHRLMRGTLEVERSELQARLNLIEHRLAMIPAERSINMTVANDTVRSFPGEWNQVK